MDVNWCFGLVLLVLDSCYSREPWEPSMTVVDSQYTEPLTQSHKLQAASWASYIGRVLAPAPTCRNHQTGPVRISQKTALCFEACTLASSRCKSQWFPQQINRHQLLLSGGLNRPSKYLYLEKWIHITYFIIKLDYTHYFGIFAKMDLTSRVSVQYSTSPAKLLTHLWNRPPSAWVWE